MELSMLWWLIQFEIFFPGTIILYLSPKPIRYAYGVGKDPCSIVLNLERERWEEKSIWCDNLRCECESIYTLPFTPEHFIFCGSPNFLPKFMQFIMNFKKLKFRKSSKAFAKVTKIISIITLRKRELPEGIISLNILNSTRCSWLHLLVLYFLEALEFS